MQADHKTTNHRHDFLKSLCTASFIHNSVVRETYCSENTDNNLCIVANTPYSYHASMTGFAGKNCSENIHDSIDHSHHLGGVRCPGDRLGQK